MTLPVSLDTRTVTGTIKKGDGSGEVGTVKFTRTTVLTSTGEDMFITPWTDTATLDAQGYFEITVPVGTDPDWAPSGWSYQIDIETTGWKTRFNYTLAPGTTIDLSDMLPAGPVSPAVSYIVASTMGQPGGPAGPLDVDGKVPAAQLPAGSGGGAVDSVNGQTGVVVLDATDVGAAPTSHAHAEADVTGLTASLAGKAPTVHTHTTGQVTGLDTALAGKSDTGHTHAISNVTGLQTALDGKQAAGSYAAASHTHGTADVTGLDTALAGKASTTDLTSGLAGKANTAHTHVIDDTVGLTGALDGKAPTEHTHSVAWGDITAKPTTFTPTTHSHTSGDVTDLVEAIGDNVAALLVAGSGVSLTYNDVAGTITVASTVTAGTGDVVGPNGTIDNRVVRMDGGTGKLIQASPLTISDAGDLSGGRMVTRAVAADFGSDYLDRLDLNYTPTTTDMDVSRVYVNGILAQWLNEIGFLRGTPHAGYKDDALVRGRGRSDMAGTEAGGYLELQNSGSNILHRRRWRDGALVRGDGSGSVVVCADVLVLASGDPVPAGTPAGTVILREV